MSSVIYFRYDYLMINDDLKEDATNVVPPPPPRDLSTSLRETVSEGSSVMCRSKSPNKHTKLFMEAVTMPDNSSKDIERGEVAPRDDLRSRSCRASKTNMNLQVGEYQHLSKLIETYQNLSKLGSLDFKLTSSGLSK